MDHFEWVVIGGGPAGFESALNLAGRGMKVAIVEKRELGGVCLNRGCIPTKVMISAAKRIERLKSAKRYGISMAEASFSYPTLKRHQERVVKGLRKGLEQRIREAGITIIDGEANLSGQGLVVVTDNNGRKTCSLTFEKVVIASGTAPIIPSPWMGVEGVVSSEDFWTLDDLPRDILIVGGGVIGCEYASALSSLGYNITLVEQMDRVLFTEEPETSEAVSRSLRNGGVRLLTGKRINDIKKTETGLMIEAGSEFFSSSLVVCCMGRVREKAPAGVDLTGVASLKLDDRTWIAGDIAPGPKLAHKAAYDADIIVDHALGRHTEPRYDNIPMAVFTSPEVGRAGLTEEEAKARFEVESRTMNLGQMGKAAADSVSRGFLKIVIDSKSRRVLGMTIVGHEASELSGYASLVLHNEMTVDDLGRIVFPHPTLGEIFRETAREFK